MKMFKNVIESTSESFIKRKNNRKQTKVFDPCISNKKKKIASDAYENNSLELKSQFYKLQEHLRSSEKDLNKTLDELCHELGMNKYISEDDSSGEEFANVPQNNDSVDHCLKQMFEGLDDYATFNAKTMSTPKEGRKAFSAVDSNIKSTPWLLCGGLNIRTMQGSKFEKCPITPRANTCCSNTQLPEPKVSGGSDELNQSNNLNTSRAILVDKTNLLETPVIHHTSITQASPRTPFLSIQQSNSRPFTPTPQQSTKKSLSPEIELPPEIKRTLLLGVICYVDVKTNKEDCSSSVALELLSMGANVEKTFNKKVSHVVFKEGKPSTYMKAKKLNITMVSVLWIEACKKARQIVDPSVYPPINIEKYANLSPNAKKLPTLKTVQRKIRKHILREHGLLTTEGKRQVRINWRNAISEIKMRPNNSQQNSQERFCQKKLNFQKTEKENFAACNFNMIDKENKENILTTSCNKHLLETSIISISDSSDVPAQQPDADKLEDSNSYKLSPPGLRRKSAPARFITVRRKRKRQELEPIVCESQKFVTIEKLFAKQMMLNAIKRSKLCINDEGSVSTQSSQVSCKKRKLFNPHKAVVTLNTPDKETATPPPVIYEFPYGNEDKNVSTNNRQTKSTSLRKVFKKTVSKKPAARKSLSSLLEQEENSRNSLTYFVDTRRNDPKLPKEPPTIVCTSLLPEEVRKASYIIGKLGVFDIEEKVSSRTTHLITSAPRRTINLLKALVRGAWILHVDWLYKSDDAGYWLNEEEFELKTFSYAVTELRRERQAFGSQFCSDLFSKCGPIYVSKRSIPPSNDICELIRLSKGQLVLRSNLAHYIIGGKAIEGENAVRVKEKWILDSITQNMLLDTERYLLSVQQT